MLQCVSTGDFPEKPGRTRLNVTVCVSRRLSREAKFYFFKETKIESTPPFENNSQDCSLATFNFGQFLISMKQGNFVKVSSFLSVREEYMHVPICRCRWPCHWENNMPPVSFRPPTAQEDSTGLLCLVSTDYPAFLANLKC